ncbi:MAG: AMP-binding protein [candidate division NC10 bacterium]
MMLVGEHLRHNARRFPGKTALIDGRTRIGYADLNALANRIAHGLAADGVARGDRVAILADARIEWVAAYLGIVKLGAVAVPCNYRQTPAEVGHTVADSGSRILFATLELRDALGGTLEVGRTVLLDDAGPDGLEALVRARPVTEPAAGVRPEDPNVILYTGGTTGKSKGVVLSHANLFWNSLNEILDTHMREDDNTILATPLHHSAALNCWLLPHLYLGATATLLPKYSAEAMLRTIERERVTNGFTPPSMARELFTHPLAPALDLSSFRRWYIGGGILPRQDREAIHRLLPGARIYYQYGLTEAGPIVTVLREEDYERAPDSIGRAFRNCEVTILREDLSDAAPGDVGEIAVRGPAVMTEYWKRPDATAAVFHQGWLRTGDMGRMDDAGFVHFHDRLKDMIKTGGLNVYSQAVEHALLKHPAVREAGVIGLPSREWGEEVIAVVVLRDGHTATEAHLRAFCRQTLAGYEVPKRVVFLRYEEMPINYSGKILKRELRARLLR